jgi:2-polyprenyl-6-methoxyphenol hydroxylase-like FAD-dependent oxidoreductase
LQSLSTTCVIAGGGPAGLMAGYLLARAGVDVTVLEKHKDFLRDFRGDTIHPSTLELMHELGLLERFLQLPHSEIRRLTIEIGREKFTIGDFSKVSTICKFIGLMPQWDFLNFMAEEAKRFPHFHLLMETEAKDLLAVKKRIAGVLARGPGGTIVIRAGLTIAADGRGSVLRDSSCLPLKEIGAPFDVLWLRLPVEKTDPVDIVGRVMGGQFMVMIYRGDYWQCALGIPKGSFTEIKREGITGFRARLRTIAGFARERVEAITSFDQVKLLTVSVNRLEKWARPGLLCIGDAAHAMSPVGGVGVNLAIQDAVAAANILGPIMRSGVPKLDDLKKIQKRREFPTKVIQFVQVQAQNRIIAPTLRAARTPRPPAIVRLIDRYPALQRIPAQLVGVGVRPEHVAFKSPPLPPVADAPPVIRGEVLPMVKKQSQERVF